MESHTSKVIQELELVGYDFSKGSLSEVLAARSRWRLQTMVKHASNFQKEFHYPLSTFLITLESGFEKGMTWENHGEWHIDHINPVSSFDLSDLNNYRKVNHFRNLQPLWAADNMSKGNSVKFSK